MDEEENEIDETPPTVVLEAGPPIEIDYTNWRGERSTRKVYPFEFFFGSTEHHKEPQYLLHAYDVGKESMRVFAFNNIHAWETVEHNYLMDAFRVCMQEGG